MGAQGYVGTAVFGQGRLLLVQQEDYFEPDTLDWTLPSGAIEAGEPCAVAAAREVREETGCLLDPNDLELVSSVTNTHRGVEISTSWNFTATSTQCDLDPDDGVDGEVVTAEWLDIDDAIDKLANHRYPPIREPALRFLRTGQRGLHWTFELMDLKQRPPQFTWTLPVGAERPRD